MMFKVSMVLTVVCFIQAIQSVPIGDISPETRQKLAQAIVDATQAKKVSGDQVNAIRNVVEYRVDAALKPIEQQLDDLKAEVKKAKNEAKISQTNIDECLDAEHEAVRNVDKDVVKDCRRMKETVQAGYKVGEIGYQVRRLHKAVHECIREADQDACVIQVVDAVKERVAQLQKEVTEILKNANPDNQTECISKGAQQLKAQVDKIVQDWRTCLEQHKSTSS